MSEANRRPTLNPASIVVGDPVAGEAYFNGAGGCRTCHSPVSDLKGVGTKYNACHPAGPHVQSARDYRRPARRASSQGRSDSGQGHTGIRPADFGQHWCRLTISSSRSSTPMALDARLNGRSAAACRRSRSTIRSRPIDSRCSVHRRDHAQPRRLPGDAQVKNRALLVSVVVAAVVVTLSAQAELDLQLLKKPPTEAWPTFHGDYSGRHYSTLKQIDTSTVANLRIEWQSRANISPQGAQTGGTVEQACCPVFGPGAAEVSSWPRRSW